jgi:uncharacterized protein (TIGR02722 family)
MKKRYLLAVLLSVAVCLPPAGCSKKVVKRVEPEEVIDLSGRWNDTDSRLVSEEMIADCMNHPWLSKHVTTTSKDPVVIVGAIRNKSSEHIAVGTFTSDIERAFINSGEVNVVASSLERQDLREEKQDQARFATIESLKKQGVELGADYMMTGEINSIIDQEEGEKVVFYQVDLSLIDIQTNAKVWIGQKKIKKFIERKRVSY